MMKPKRIKWAGHAAQIGEKRHTYVIGGKARRKETITKTMTYVNNIKIKLSDTG
jgi:hypothetical protein